MPGRALTEHQMQQLLTTHWLADGIDLDGELLDLVAWEVTLPSWRINAAHTWFGQPAIDFVAIDGDGGDVAIELPVTTVGSPVPG